MQDRIERTGRVEPLTPRIKAFLCEALEGRSLDDLQDPKERRVDYLCLDGLLAVEVKSLEDDGGERMGNLLAELQERDDWPLFLGSAPVEAFLQHTNDPEGLRRKTLERIGRSAVNHLKWANKQFEAHCIRFPRSRTVRVVIYANEDHEAYDPDTMGFVLLRALGQKIEGRPRYEHIDFALYFTERHGLAVDGLTAFPILVVEGLGVRDDKWKIDVAQDIVKRWAEWSGRPLREADALASFTTIENVPEAMSRGELWALEYRRRPYLKALSREQLRDRFDEVALMGLLAGAKGAPLLLPEGALIDAGRLFGDLLAEMGNRAIPITEFRHDPERQVAACRRLKLPDKVISWLETITSNAGGQDR